MQNKTVAGLRSFLLLLSVIMAMSCTPHSENVTGTPDETVVSPVNAPGSKTRYQRPLKRSVEMTVETIVRAFESENWRVFDAYIGAMISPSREEVLNLARDAARDVEEVEYQIVFDGVVEGENRYAVKFHWFRLWKNANDNVVTRAEGRSEWHIDAGPAGLKLAQMLGDELW